MWRIQDVLMRIWIPLFKLMRIRTRSRIRIFKTERGTLMVPSPRSWKRHSHDTKSQILEEVLSWYQVPDPGRGTLMLASTRSWKRHSHVSKFQILEEVLSWYQVPDPGRGTLKIVASPRSWKRHSHGTKF